MPARTRSGRIASDFGKPPGAVLDRAQQRTSVELHPGVGAELRRGLHPDDQARGNPPATEQPDEDERAREAAGVAGQVVERALDDAAEAPRELVLGLRAVGQD